MKDGSPMADDDTCPDDTTGPAQPNAARVCDWLLKGDEESGCFSTPADRAAGRILLAIDPDCAERARSNRRFVTTAARLAAEAGVSQFLDLGCGLPSAPSVHGEAREVNPAAVTAYIDADSLVKDAWEAAGCAGAVPLCADIEDLAAVLKMVQLDMSRPVCVILGSVVQLLADPEGAVEGYKAVMARGSWLAISAIHYRSADLLARTRAMAGRPVRSHTAAELRRMLSGLQMVPPGIAEVSYWLSGISYIPRERGDAVMLAGVAVKP